LFGRKSARKAEKKCSDNIPYEKHIAIIKDQLVKLPAVFDLFYR